MTPDRCDRRLSRAARELLREHLFDAWSEAYVLTGDTKFDVDVSTWNVWQFLEATLAVPVESRLANDMSCPLVPSRDVYREHEMLSRVVDGSVARSIQNAAIPGAMHSARKEKRPNHAVFHQCGACQKNFTSHFYLDQHMDDKHIGNKSMLASRELICPAIAYCEFLSPIACFDQATLLEPFYGPGSDGYSSDRHAVQHKLLQMQPICSEQNQRAAIISCHEIVDVCFEGVFGQILSANMCSRIQSCHDRLLHRMIGSSLMIHPERWYGAFSHTYEGRMFNGIVLVMAAFAIFVLYGIWVWRTIRSKLVTRRVNRKSLLNNNVASKRSLNSPMTFIGSSLKMKKN